MIAASYPVCWSPVCTFVVWFVIKYHVCIPQVWHHNVQQWWKHEHCWLKMFEIGYSVFQKHNLIVYLIKFHSYMHCIIWYLPWLVKHKSTWAKVTSLNQCLAESIIVIAENSEFIGLHTLETILTILTNRPPDNASSYLKSIKATGHQGNEHVKPNYIC